MISADFQGTDVRVKTALKEKFPLILDLVRNKMDQLDLQLQQKIQNEKLQGQVLEHRTGKLVGSIRFIKAKVDGEVVEGGVEGAGGPAFYGRYQNYGTEREYEIVPRNKKALAFIPSGGKMIVPMNKAMIRQTIRAFNSKQANVRAGAFKQFGNMGGVVVKKVIHPPIQKRNFMESTADEFKPEMTKGIAAAIAAGLRKI